MGFCHPACNFKFSIKCLFSSSFVLAFRTTPLNKGGFWKMTPPLQKKKLEEEVEDLAHQIKKKLMHMHPLVIVMYQNNSPFHASYSIWYFFYLMVLIAVIDISKGRSFISHLVIVVLKNRDYFLSGQVSLHDQEVGCLNFLSSLIVKLSPTFCSNPVINVLLLYIYFLNNNQLTVVQYI